MKLPNMPRKPTLLVIDECTMQVSWCVPQSDRNITCYSINVFQGNPKNPGSCFKEEVVVSNPKLIMTPPGDTISTLVKGFEVGMKYRIEVAAMSSIGWGPYSPWSDFVTCTPPRRPKQPRLEVVDGCTMRVSWVEPESSFPVTHYQVSVTSDAFGPEYCCAKKGAMVSAPEDAMPWPSHRKHAVVRGFEPGVRYRAQVAARSDGGWSQCSLSSCVAKTSAPPSLMRDTYPGSCSPRSSSACANREKSDFESSFWVVPFSYGGGGKLSRGPRGTRPRSACSVRW